MLSTIKFSAISTSTNEFQNLQSTTLLNSFPIKYYQKIYEFFWYFLWYILFDIFLCAIIFMFRLETSIPSLIGWLVGWSVFKKKSSIYLTYWFKSLLEQPKWTLKKPQIKSKTKWINLTKRNLDQKDFPKKTKNKT